MGGVVPHIEWLAGGSIQLETALRSTLSPVMYTITLASPHVTAISHCHAQWPIINLLMNHLVGLYAIAMSTSQARSGHSLCIYKRVSISGTIFMVRRMHMIAHWL